MSGKVPQHVRDAADEQTVSSILRSLPEDFWDVTTWTREHRSYLTGPMDPADRKRIVAAVVERLNVRLVPLYRFTQGEPE